MQKILFSSVTSNTDTVTTFDATLSDSTIRVHVKYVYLSIEENFALKLEYNGKPRGFLEV